MASANPAELDQDQCGEYLESVFNLGLASSGTASSTKRKMLDRLDALEKWRRAPLTRTWATFGLAVVGLAHAYIRNDEPEKEGS